MPRTTVQIYEIQDAQEAREMARLGVDTVGSVLTSRQDWKQDSLVKSMAAARDAGLTTSLIPLFSEPGLVLEVLDYYKPDMAHFCDTLTNAAGYPLDLALFISLQEQVRTAFPKMRIMRSIPIARPGKGHVTPTLKLAMALEPVSDVFLTDTWLGDSTGAEPSDPVQGYIGITGLICDWDIAADLVKQSAIPVILAGGISPGNAYEGVLRVRPAGVDSCTQTNALDENGSPIRFKKDPEKVQALVNEVARADTEIAG
ncbi:MAG: hypothetical protein JEZ02_12980 [Desulfatibacillum sp.]|nr:hypothetical protein [Desulfatibacillum sp.]